MTYGTINSTIINHYNKTSYTLDGTTYSSIHVFKTNPNSETVSPAVYTTGNKKTLSNMNPNGIAASKVMAKTNGNVMGGGTSASGVAFYGVFYANGQLYYNGNAIDDAYSADCDSFRGYPALCLKNNGDVIIRWFENNTKLANAYTFCRAIISGTTALVYDGQSVFANTVTSSDGHVIADVTDLRNSNNHHNEGHLNGGAMGSYKRTILGHDSDGAYYLVVTDTSMDLIVASKLMEKMGCDYAINLDGAGSSQMRVASQYLNDVPGAVAGKVSSSGSSSNYYGTGVIAHLI